MQGQKSGYIASWMYNEQETLADHLFLEPGNNPASCPIRQVPARGLALFDRDHWVVYDLPY